MPQALPANPDLDWLKKAAKKRLADLRARAPETKLHLAQLAVANDYGFKSWRALKAHVDDINGVANGREGVFAAARAGDVEAVRRAFASGRRRRIATGARSTRSPRSCGMPRSKSWRRISRAAGFIRRPSRTRCRPSPPRRNPSTSLHFANGSTPIRS
jgi:hypothetical protein